MGGQSTARELMAENFENFWNKEAFPGIFLVQVGVRAELSWFHAPSVKHPLRRRKQ